MARYVFATSPYSALVRIYAHMGVWIGPIKLYKVMPFVWKWEKELR
jgi:hypothetical protein